MTKKRNLTPDEKKLWQDVTKHDKKLSRRQPEEPAQDEDENVRKPHSQELNMQLDPALLRKTVKPQKHRALPQQGQYDGIDRNTAERFRKGELPIDATLDLHGYTQAQAQPQLRRFIASHHARGSRMLLIITGKGTKSSPDEERRGILREALPRWLADEALAPCVLAFDVAKQKHGGSGAYYVLLRRKR